MSSVVIGETAQRLECDQAAWSWCHLASNAISPMQSMVISARRGDPRDRPRCGALSALMTRRANTRFAPTQHGSLIVRCPVPPHFGRTPKKLPITLIERVQPPDHLAVRAVHGTLAPSL